MCTDASCHSKSNLSKRLKTAYNLYLVLDRASPKSFPGAQKYRLPSQEPLHPQPRSLGWVPPTGEGEMNKQSPSPPFPPWRESEGAPGRPTALSPEASETLTKKGSPSLIPQQTHFRRSPPSSWKIGDSNVLCPCSKTGSMRTRGLRAGTASLPWLT